MLLCSSPGYCTPACQLLIQPFYTLAVTQDMVNTFTHVASERFITRGPSVIFIHTSNSISSLSIKAYHQISRPAGWLWVSHLTFTLNGSTALLLLLQPRLLLLLLLIIIRLTRHNLPTTTQPQFLMSFLYSHSHSAFY